MTPEEGAGWGALAGAITGAILGNAGVATQVGGIPPSNSFWGGVVAGTSFASAAAGAAIGSGAGYEVGKRRCAKLMSDSGTRPIQNFSYPDAANYIKYPWFPQFQNPQSYQTKDELQCTSAHYTKKVNEQKNAVKEGGWFLDVSNMGETTNQANDTKGFLCAKIHDLDKAEGWLDVGPCSMKFGGPYWIVKYNDAEGYAIILGGMPDRMVLPDKESTLPVKCGFRNKMTNGMWAFTRQRNPPAALKTKLMDIMNNELKLDTSDLLTTPQDNCGAWDAALIANGAKLDWTPNTGIPRWE